MEIVFTWIYFSLADIIVCGPPPPGVYYLADSQQGYLFETMSFKNIFCYIFVDVFYFEQPIY